MKTMVLMSLMFAASAFADTNTINGKTYTCPEGQAVRFEQQGNQPPKVWCSQDTEIDRTNRQRIVRQKIDEMMRRMPVMQMDDEGPGARD